MYIIFVQFYVFLSYLFSIHTFAALPVNSLDRSSTLHPRKALAHDLIQEVLISSPLCVFGFFTLANHAVSVFPSFYVAI